MLFFIFIIVGAFAQNGGEPKNNIDDENKNFNNPDYTIFNSVIKIGISNRNAGAVCSMVFDGVEFVNDHDHGRQMQVAWIYNGMGEEYNPTEAGADYDQMGQTSTSQLLSVKIDKNTIKTVSHPAFWFFYGQGNHQNTSAVSKDSLIKVLTLGYEGDPNVIVFDTEITLSPEITGPIMNALRIEAPTVYSSSKLTKHNTFDLDNGQIAFVPSNSQKNDVMNRRIGPISKRNLVPVMSSTDGKFALAVYTQQQTNFWGYYTWEVPSEDTLNACTKITSFFKHAAEVQKTYKYKSFVVCGSFEIVKNSLLRLKK